MSVQIAGHAGFAGRIVDRIKALAGVGGGLAIRYGTHISRYITLFVLVFAMFGCIVSECCRVVDLALGKFCARGSCPKEPTGKAGGQTSIQTCDAGHSKAGCFRCPGSWVIDILTMLSLADLR